MKKLTAAISLVVLATGTAGAAIAYVSAAPQSSADQTVSAPAPATPKAAPRAQVTRPAVRIKVRYRTCRHGAQLEHGKCVRHVVHTVVVAAPPPPPAPAVATVSSTGQTASARPRHRSGAHAPRPPQAGQTTAAAGNAPGSPEDHATPQPPEPSDD